MCLIAISALFALRPLDQLPSFEVGIRQAQCAAEPFASFTVTADDRSPGQIHYQNMNLKDLLTRAFDLKDYQVEGPDWLNIIGLAVVLGAFSLYLNKDWFAGDYIQIHP